MIVQTFVLSVSNFQRWYFAIPKRNPMKKKKNTKHANKNEQQIKKSKRREQNKSNERNTKTTKTRNTHTIFSSLFVQDENTMEKKMMAAIR